MKEEIKKLIEQRTAEARKKDISEKSMRVLKAIGHEIKQDELNCTWDEEEDWDTDEFDLPEYSDGSSTIVGLYYDFLSSGYNMQITNNFHRSELTINVHGNLVYQEINGELRKYVPFQEWEDKLESMFEFTKKKERQEKREDHITKEIAWERQKKNLLDYLKDFWGFRV